MTGATLRIALAEARRHTKLFDRRVVLVALILGLVLGVSWPAIQDRGVHPESGLYVVAMEGPTPLAPVLEREPSFILTTVQGAQESGYTLDLLVSGDQVSYEPSSEKSKAALRQLELATHRWLNDQLAGEEDTAAAFPVQVNVVYQTRNIVADGSVGGGPEPAPDGTDTEERTQEAPNATPSGGETDQPPAPELLDQQGDQQVGLRPDQLDPPFPLRSLLLTFAYLIPLTFISELYSGSIFSEKVRSRGIMLLSGPVTGGQVLAGKSLPYVVLMALVATGVTVAIGSNLVGLMAVVPIVAFALASSLLLSLLSRSQRALTFLLVSTNVALSTFLFLPALFTQIEPVAFLSPVTVIAATIRGDPVGLGPFLYATLPMAVAACTLAGVSVSFYKAEHLFTPAGLATRLVDAVQGLMRSAWSFLAAGALAVPFAFAIELFVLIFAVTLDLSTAFYVFLIGSAVVEESLKALPSYAHNSRSTTPRWRPWTMGGLVGLGFFLGEKGALAFTLLGFGLLPRGNAALATFGIASTPLLVVAPLLLHVGTATITAWTSTRGKQAAVLGWTSAVLVHVSYNLLAIQLVGGGFP